MNVEIDEIEHAIPWDLGPAPESEGHTVAELLPPGHECYLRLFHPFVPWELECSVEPVEPRTTWGALAALAGLELTPTTTWKLLEPALPDDGERRPWTVWDGDIEVSTAKDLFGILGVNSTGPYFFEFGLAAVISADDHRPHLYRSPSIEGRHAAAQRIRHRGAGWVNTPSLAWDQAQTWITCSDHDLTSTYIASTERVGQQLLDHPDLETVEVQRTTRIDDWAHEQEGGPPGQTT
ncbi:hypothetical protein PO878_00780 [Iamia majanohamensis]|uniref:Uncharacterized protein n=1 Tax=Iamia majanohamensis TaxID=467976 RepID=A0AAF0BVY9_9ACTN|nr:hypothetical protein [Iamia majanohamensis]WCO67255.1 hypothetical protein PO878_00780 [Iamia majanohamensis]